MESCPCGMASGRAGRAFELVTITDARGWVLKILEKPSALSSPSAWSQMRKDVSPAGSIITYPFFSLFSGKAPKQ